MEGKEHGKKEILSTFDVKGNTISGNNGHCRNIWGDYYLEPTADLYILLAKTAGKLRMFEGQEELQDYIEELGVPIITELEFVTRFGDRDDVDWEENPEVLQNISYEMFCKHYEVDPSINEEIFNKFREDAYNECFTVEDGNYVSLDGRWEKAVYMIAADGTIYNEDGNVDENMMKMVSQLEAQIKK